MFDLIIYFVVYSRLEALKFTGAVLLLEYTTCR